MAGRMTLDQQQLQKLPMFPLPNVVLLPGGLLPLHIFEQRYRDMTRDLLAGPGLLAMARLRADTPADEAGQPAVYSTVGVGQVIASARLEDGRYNILVRGLCRAEVAEELVCDTLYRQVRAVPLDDIDAEPMAVLRATQDKLLSLCDQLADSLEPSGPQLRALIRSASSPGACADIVSAVLVADPDERQAQLENLDPGQRLERAIRHVDHILSALHESGEHSVLN